MDDSFERELQEEIEEEENLAVIEDMDNVVDVVNGDENIIESTDEEEEVEEEGLEDETVYPENRGRKRKPRAAIWQTAAKKVENKAQCNVCHQFYACPQGNTSNIRTHVKTAHPGSEECKQLLALEKEMKEARKKKKKPKITMMNFITSKKPLARSESVKLTDSVVDFLVQTNTSIKMVENPAFRKMLFVFHSGYVAPSRTTIMKLIEKKIKDKEEALKEEIKRDIVETKTVSTTTDGGPSHDQNKTKKNTVTCSRIDSKWNLKTDTLALVVAEGTQSGEVIRTVVKMKLDKFGMEDGGWHVNMTTDDASAPRSARAPNRHPGVGLTVKYDTMCIDHQFHLLVSFTLFVRWIFFFFSFRLLFTRSFEL
jgi:hypothetical protein